MKKEINFILTRQRKQEVARAKRRVFLVRTIPVLSAYFIALFEKKQKNKSPFSKNKESFQGAEQELNKLYEKYVQEDIENKKRYEEKKRKEAEIEEKNKAFERERLRLEQEETQNRLNAEKKGINEVIKVIEKRIVSVINEKDEIKVVLDNGVELIINSSELKVNDFFDENNRIKLSNYEYNLLKRAVKAICEDVENFNMLTQKNKMLYTITKERKL